MILEELASEYNLSNEQKPFLQLALNIYNELIESLNGRFLERSNRYKPWYFALGLSVDIDVVDLFEAMCKDIKDYGSLCKYLDDKGIKLN